MRVRATIEYMGAAYAGWQMQPAQRTVQSAIEKALETVVGTRVPIESAGRTDSGVHALGQVAAFDLPDGTDVYRLRASLNGLTPDDVSVVDIVEVAADFDPRRHAKSRTYEYTIVSGRPRSPMLEDRSWFYYHEFDIDRLVADEDCVLTEGVMKMAYPGATLIAMGHAVDDPEAYYLYEARMATLWPFGDDGLAKGEDTYTGGDGFAGIGDRKLSEADLGELDLDALRAS